jgi:UDP-N-acetylenolpyruvoylglucosamine reductase
MNLYYGLSIKILRIRKNMSLIPGNVGTTPVQNIGAYGAEIKDTLLIVKQ